MKAAVIDTPGAAPRYADFDDPTPNAHETLVTVTAAGLHPIVKALAGGEHYGSDGAWPLVPGIDGTGRLADGTPVYFGGARAPWGTMAEIAAAPTGFCLPLPPGLDEVTAAAVMNPGLAAWLALHWRAELKPGETVLVLGATGVSGRLTVALAQRLGAGRVIAAGRNRAVLESLAGVETVVLGGPDDAAAIAAAAGDGIHVIVDFLWGAPTEAAIKAVTRRGLTHSAPRCRLVEVGQSAGPTITLPADVLRSSGLEIVGSGGGTVPVSKIVATVPEFMAVAAAGDLPLDIDERPLSEVTAGWSHPGGGRRVVFRP